MSSIQLPGISVNQVQEPSNFIKADVLFNDRTVQFYLDTCSDVTTINEETYKDVGSPPTTNSAVNAKAFGGFNIKFKGEGSAVLSANGRSSNQIFYVASRGALNPLGIKAMRSLGFLRELFNQDVLDAQVNVVDVSVDSFTTSLKSSFPDIFSPGLGCCTKLKATFHLKKDARPVFKRARQVAYARRDEVNKELDRLHEMGVITPIASSEWAAPIVIQKKKNGSARLCNDYSTGLNDSLEPNRYPLPLPDDIFATLNGGQVFSQIDFSDAYLQVELEDETKKLCTINTAKGLFQFNRLPFGAKPAPGIFQRIMDTLLSKFDFAIAYLDDIIIASKSMEEHRNHLHLVFAAISEYEFKIKLEKCSFLQTSIKYLGYIIDKFGRRPDPKKIEAIVNMPPPYDLSTLRSYLGMINFYQNYLPDLAHHRHPMDALTQKESE